MTINAAERVGERDGSRVDPRAPRFGQGITATALLAGVALSAPEPVFAVAAILAAAALTRWRIDLYGFVWREVIRRVVGPPEEPEPAAPHRFAKLLGAIGSVLASGLLLAGVEPAGYAVAAAVGLAAGLAATTGLCLGCKMYRGVSLFRRFGWV